MAAVCPKCGSSRTKEAPSGFGTSEGFVLVRDRICRECDERFTPPIPVWAPYALTLAGAILFLAGAGIGVAYVFSDDRGGRPGRMIAGLAALAAAGGWLVVKGVKMIRGMDSENKVF